MAMMDYGAIAFKNGKLISTNMFTPMEATCGFSDEGSPLPQNQFTFDKNYFVVIGNERMVFGFYKTSVSWWIDQFPNETDPSRRYTVDYRWFDFGEYEKWRRWSKAWFLKNHEGSKGDVTDGELVEFIVKPRNGYFVARLKNSRDEYKVYFGCGVDFSFYKKTRRVNYYRSPEFLLLRWKFDIECFFDRVKSYLRRKPHA